MRASTGATSEALLRALRVLSDGGYPYARLGVAEWHQDSGAVDVVLGGALGPEVVVSEVRIDGLAVTRRALVDRVMGPLAGRPFDRTAAFVAAERLQRLGLFRRASYEGLEGESDWSRGHLVYRVEEPAYNRFEGVVGVQGATGTVGLARLDLGNLAGTGRAVHLGWERRGRGLSDLRARVVEPLLLGWPVRLEAALDQQLQDTLYTRTRWGARGRYALGEHEGLEAGYEQERVVQEHGPVEQASLQSTVFALERQTLDEARAARRGTRVRVEAAQVFKREILRPNGQRTARASAVRITSDWHRPLGPATGLALALQAAGRFSSERVLPLYERYPIGGAATLRGFDEEALRVDRYGLSRLEWRFFLDSGAQHVYLFWDHAETATREAIAAGGDRLVRRHLDGTGVGLRLEAAGGLVGVDYGLEPGRPFLEGKIHLQLVTTF
jgi:outer membrane protein assembly factor BamA